jgi:hypothetical protein
LTNDDIYGEEEADPMKLQIPVSSIIMSFNKPVKNKLLTINEDQETLDLNHSIKDIRP